MEDELLCRLVEGKLDLSNPIVERQVNSFITFAKSKMETLLTSLVRLEGTITIKLDNYRSIIKRPTSCKTSEAVYVCGVPWRAGYEFIQLGKHYMMNLLLSYTDKCMKTCDAEVEVCMKDQQNSCRNFVRCLSHTFKSDMEFCFPFVAFQREIEDPKFGYLLDDSLIIEITIRAEQSAVESAVQTPPNTMQPTEF